MFYPENKLRASWDFFVLAITVLGAIVIPLSVVFDYFTSDTAASVLLITPAVFIADILVQFNTGFYRLGKIVTKRSSVALRYLKRWFTLDLLAALPMGLVFRIFFPAAGTLSLLLTLNPLLKLIHSGTTLYRIGGTRVNPAILRLVLLIFWILLVAHLVSCGWILISSNPENLTPVPLYIRAFYWTITTLTTIGYGDITPTGSMQTIFVIFIELLGAAMYGMIIGNIANLIANINVAKSQYKDKLDKINAFLNYRNIPYDLQRKINDYYNYLWESRRGYDEAAVIQDLPIALKTTVALQINREIIEKVPLFQSASEDLIREIVLNLKPVVFTPGDTIVTAGEVGFQMYFISQGSVDVLSADEHTVYATLTAGQFFGEIALLLSMPRTATIRAREYCDLYRLDKENFDRVIQRYPDFAERINELAEKRKAEIEAIQQTKDQETKERDIPEEIEEIQAEHTGGAVTLRWNWVKDLRRYEVIRRDPRTGKWVYLEKNALEPNVTDPQPDTDRPTLYRIRAIKTSGPGAWSKTLAVEPAAEEESETE
ncbi:MAG: cyclic nucleotide-binding domain-containing protein [Spirochaetaceae bacterium]|nr:MAG: cyclic nucleotide-binding domain-containing protein [Spirochaetaceae bacterium]